MRGSNKKKKKKIVVKNKGAFIAALAVLLAIIAAVLFFVLRKPMVIEAGSAYIYEFVEGRGTSVIRDGKTRNAYKGMRLLEGDIVFTDENSKVCLKLDDNKNVYLEYNTRMEIGRFSDGKLLLELKDGQYYFDVTTKLKSGESMLFKICNTTVSIRGTSGTGSLEANIGKFTIFTGVGDVESVNTKTNEVSEYVLNPNNKVEFDTFAGKTVSGLRPGIVGESDIPDVIYIYIKDNDSYKQELIDEGWDISGGTKKKNDDIVISLPDDISGGNYVGYRQRADGTWYFDEEDYKKGIGPTPYKDFMPISLTATTTVYNGELQHVEIEGFNPVSMKISNDEHKDAGTYKLIVSPRDTWAEGTTDSIVVTWVIKQKTVIITTDDAKKEYKQKDPKFTSTIEGVIEGESIKYSVERESGEETGSYLIKVIVNEDEYPNYKIEKREGSLNIYTSFNIYPTSEGGVYSYDYDGRPHKPDKAVTVTDPNGTTLLYSEDNELFAYEEPSITNSGTKTIYVRAVNERYDYQPECTYKLVVNPTVVTAYAKGYFANKEIQLVAEVDIPPKVSFNAEYYLYEINDYLLNKERATVINSIVANGTYVAYPTIKVLDDNFVAAPKYTKITVKSMLFHIYSHDYYDSLEELLASYEPE